VGNLKDVKQPKAYPSFERDGLQILNNPFSLFVVRKNEIKIRIAPVSSKDLNKNVNFIFGLSSETKSIFNLSVREKTYTQPVYPGKIIQISLPLQTGDTLIIQNTTPDKDKDDFYLSTPHISNCS
jgi:hypothetical protein